VYEPSRKTGPFARGKKFRATVAGGGGQVDDAIGDAAINEDRMADIGSEERGGDGERTKASGHVDRSAATSFGH